MDLSAWQLQLEAIVDESDKAAVEALAAEANTADADAIVDAVIAALATTAPASRRRLHYWFLLDRLCKTSPAFVGPVGRRFVATVVEYAPACGSDAFEIFVYLLDSMRHFLGAVVAVAKAKLGIPLDGSGVAAPSSTSADTASASAAASAGRTAGALVLHRAALTTMGGFMARKDNTQRTGPLGSLQVRTRDSVGAVKAANAYAPAMAVELAMAPIVSDADAPTGYRQALPAGHAEDYRRARQKRLRETFEQSRREAEERANKRALAELEGTAGGEEGGNAAGGKGAVAASSSNLAADDNGGRSNLFDFSDVVMPAELPRDEFGVQIANYPLGVRFLREAIRSCGGALELETIVQRLSTLSGVDKDKFGHVREFVNIHTPTTFIVQQEKDKYVVRLREPTSGTDGSAAAATESGAVAGASAPAALPPTTMRTADGQVLFSWERLECPLCGQAMKGRNLARHANCRRCVKVQIALAIAGGRAGGSDSSSASASPIGELHVCAAGIMRSHHEATAIDGFSLASGAVFDDGDLEHFEQCLRRAAAVKRFQFSSTRLFAPILKAIGIVRARWLAIHGVTEIADIPIGPSDKAFVSFFATLGALIHRLPIAWIETGDIVDMCRRFCVRALPAHNPPPRPADPRIQMINEFPGFLFCESEIDSEDEVSPDDDEACSDDEQEQFVLAPPVSVVESLITVGFERDTRRLEYRLRTRPPMVLRKALRMGGNATQAQAYQAPDM